MKWISGETLRIDNSNDREIIDFESIYNIENKKKRDVVQVGS